MLKKTQASLPTYDKFLGQRYSTSPLAQKTPHDCRPLSIAQQNHQLMLSGQTVCQTLQGLPHISKPFCEPSKTAAVEVVHKLPVWRKICQVYGDTRCIAPGAILFPAHLRLDVHCKGRNVPNLKWARCVTWDQNGVFRLIWVQAKHTLTWLLWSVEMTWREKTQKK